MAEDHDEEFGPEHFPDALTEALIRQLAAENIGRFADDAVFFLNESDVGVTSGGGGVTVAECEDEGIAAVVATALMDMHSGRLAQVAALICLARKEADPSDRDAILQAALDFATNNEEALAEGRQWALPAAITQATGEGS